MTAATAMPGNTAETFLVHFFGTGLADERDVVERQPRAHAQRIPGNFYRRAQGTALDGMKVWPGRSPLSAPAIGAWDSNQQKTLRTEGE